MNTLNYNELTLTTMWISFPVTLWHVVNLTDIRNYTYNEAKSRIPGTLLLTCFTVLLYVFMCLCNVPIGTNKFTRAQSRKPHNGIKYQELCEKNSYFQVYLVEEKGLWLNWVFTIFLKIFRGWFKISLNGKNMHTLYKVFTMFFGFE